MKKKMNKKVVWKIVLGIIFLVIILNYINANKYMISYVLNPEQYKERELNIKKYKEMHNCKIELNQLIITGEDPYIVFDIGNTTVYDVKRNDILEKYHGGYKIYYGIDALFYEDNVAEVRYKPVKTFMVNEKINTIRIDFEDVTKGTFKITDSKIAYVNDGQLVGIYKKSLIRGAIVFFIFLAIMFGVLIWNLYKNRYKKFAISVLYLFMGESVITASLGTEKVMLFIMLNVLLLGLYLGICKENGEKE